MVGIPLSQCQTHIGITSLPVDPFPSLSVYRYMLSKKKKPFQESRSSPLQALKPLSFRGFRPLDPPRKGQVDPWTPRRETWLRSLRLHE